MLAIDFAKNISNTRCLQINNGSCDPHGCPISAGADFILD